MHGRILLVGIAGCLCSAAVAQQPAPPTPPWKGGLTHSLGQPAPNYAFIAPMVGMQRTDDGRVASGRLLAGLYRPVTNPLVGLLGFNGEAYIGLRDLQVEGGARLMLASHFLRIAGGMDLNGRSGDVDAVLSASVPVRRGGIVGSGSLLRVDWLPGRSQLELGISVPLHRNAGKTRPRSDHVSLEASKPNWMPAAPASPELQKVVTELRETIRRIDLLVTPLIDQGSGDPDEAARKVSAELRRALPPGGENAPPAVEVVRRYHELLERGFGLAADDPRAGRRIAQLARQVLLEDLLLPYNRLLGQRRSDDRLYRFQTVAWTSFMRSVRTDSMPPDKLPRVITVFQDVLDQIELARQSARERWDDGRLVWLPLQYGLRPEDHDTQAELDSLVSRAVTAQFTEGNRIVYVLADLFQEELQRTIRETRDYHVLWVHDFAGRNGTARPDSVSLDAVQHYLDALTAAVQRYDSTGRMPSYFIFLDQFYYQRSDSRLWMSVLENPLEHQVDVGRGFESLTRSITEAQRRLKAAVAQSSLLRLEARQYGKEWIPNLVKVHVSITNPPDRSFNSKQVLPFYGLPDDAIRDHRKIAFYDITPGHPDRGEAVFTGAGVGDQYVGPGWEDRAIMVQGPANLRLRDAARKLLEVQQLSGRRLPWPFWDEWPLSGDQVERGPEPDGADARVLELHNETGYAPKELSVARAVLYTLMPPGSVVVISGGMWGNYLTGSMALGAALGGAQVALLAPSTRTTSNTGWPNMTRTWEMHTRLLRTARDLAPELEAAGGRLKVGIYDPHVSANDIHGRFRAFSQSLGQGTWLDTLFSFHHESKPAIRALDSLLTLDQPPPEPPASEKGPPPKLHIKGELFATREAWNRVLGHPRFAAAMRSYAVNLARSAAPGTDGAAKVRSLAQELPRMLSPVMSDVLEQLPPERRAGLVWYLMVGSANQNNRSLMLDGEASVLLSGGSALQGLMDFIVLLGLCTWLESPEQLDQFIPPPGGFHRLIGRWIRVLI